jgi:hypothetical protein
MPATSFERMPDDARLWVFATSQPLSPQAAGQLLASVDGFLARWAAHGAPVLGARELRYERFLLVAADERATGVSGCSIDALHHAIATQEQALGAELRATASQVFYRDAAGTVQTASRAGFRQLAAAGGVNEDSVVFDNTVGTVGELRAGRWETRLGSSWHARAFPLGAPVG